MYVGGACVYMCVGVGVFVCTRVLAHMLYAEGDAGNLGEGLQLAGK